MYKSYILNQQLLFIYNQDTKLRDVSFPKDLLCLQTTTKSIPKSKWRIPRNLITIKEPYHVHFSVVVFKCDLDSSHYNLDQVNS